MLIHMLGVVANQLCMAKAGVRRPSGAAELHKRFTSSYGGTYMAFNLQRTMIPNIEGQGMEIVRKLLTRVVPRRLTWSLVSWETGCN